jgi:hypothetical protein
VALTEKVELPVAYGNVSIGDKSARLGVTVSAGNLTPNQANKLLVGRRLTGQVLARLGNGQPGQGSIPGLEKDPKLAGVFDVKSVGMTPKSYTFGLTFSLDKLDVEMLSHFAKREGILTVKDVEDLPEPIEPEEPEEPEEEEKAKKKK